MESAVKAIRKFQTVALVTTAGAVGYYFLHEGETTNFQSDSTDLKTGGQVESKKQGHTLTGELVDKDKQVASRGACYGHSDKISLERCGIMPY